MKTAFGAVSDDAAHIAATTADLVERTSALLGTEAPPPPTVVDGFIGPAYGIPTGAGTDAIAVLARTEGVLLDPVYTAKAFAHVLARPATVPDDDRAVVFLHTGGAPGLFAYTPALSG